MRRKLSFYALNVVIIDQGIVAHDISRAVSGNNSSMVRQNYLRIGNKSSNKKGVCASTLFTENTLDQNFNQMTLELKVPDIPSIIDETSFIIAIADEIVQGKGSNDSIIPSLERFLNDLSII